jgi:hypothetical protein
LTFKFTTALYQSPKPSQANLEREQGSNGNQMNQYSQISQVPEVAQLWWKHRVEIISPHCAAKLQSTHTHMYQAVVIQVLPSQTSSWRRWLLLHHKGYENITNPKQLSLSLSQNTKILK